MAKKRGKIEEISWTNAIVRISAVCGAIFIIAGAAWAPLRGEFLPWTLMAFIGVLIEEIAFYLLKGDSLLLRLSFIINTKRTPAEQVLDAQKEEEAKSWVPGENGAS